MSDEEYIVQTPSTISSFNEEISVNSNTSVSEGNYHLLSFVIVRHHVLAYLLT